MDNQDTSRQPQSTPILVVDDSNVARNLIYSTLQREGYLVDGVDTGRKALDYLGRREPSLVLLDLRLPDIDGRQVAEQIAAQGRKCPFVVITGHGDEAVAVEMMKLGAADYLAKDGLFADLLPSVVRQVLKSAHNERLLHETQRELARSQALEHLVGDISSDFVAVPPDGIAAAVAGALEKIGRFIAADRVVLVSDPGTGCTSDCVQEWCAPGIDRHKHKRQSLRMADWPWGSQQIEANGHLDIGCVEDLPPEAQKERAALSELGIKAFLGVSATVGGRDWGLLSVEMTSKHRSWSRADIRLLKTGGEICVNAMERQSALERLRKSEERLSQALASSNDGAWEWNRGNGDFFLSPRYIDRLGYAPGTFPRNASALRQILHPDDRRRVISVLRKAVRNGTRFEAECRLKSSESPHPTVLVRGKALPGADGSTARLVGTLIDISERKSFEELVLQLARGISSETGHGFFTSLVASLADVLRVDFALLATVETGSGPGRLQTVALYQDGEICKEGDHPLAGTPCEEVLHRGGYFCLDDVQAHFPKDPMLARRRARAYVGVPLCDGQGTPFGVLAVLKRSALVNPEVTESLLRLFASRAAAELRRQAKDAQLRDSERRYRKLYQEFQTILNGIAEQIALLTPGLEVIWTNRGQKTGSSDAVGFRHCFEADGQQGERCRQCPARRCFDTGETQDALVKRGTRRYGVKFFPLKKENGEVHSVISLASDVTERVRLREENERARRLASLGEVAAGVAHEINNPNALIRLNCGLAQDLLPAVISALDRYRDEHGDFPLGKMPYSRMRSELPKLTDEIDQSSRRISRIVESLREFVSPRFSEDKSRVELAGVAARAVQMLQSLYPDISFEVVEKSRPSIRASAAGIEQVVVNLLLNAVQALEDKSLPVSVETSLDRDRGRALLKVTDRGRGIAPDHLERLTEPFFTTRRESGGTGLGLAISSRIVSEQGGELSFSSKQGQGTTVELSFPALQKEREE